MESGDFLRVTATDDPARWTMVVEPRLCSHLGALFGGNALGAAVTALERTTGRPCAWASAQFLSFATESEHLDIEVVVDVAGRHLTQARATCRSSDRDVLRVSAALGRRSSELAGRWSTFPDVPPPGECELRPLPAASASRNGGNFELRTLQPLVRPGLRSDDPRRSRAGLWIRLRAGAIDTDAAWSSVLGDFAFQGPMFALGMQLTGSSLDNNVRHLATVRTEWVLLDVETHAVVDGLGHCTTRLFAECGTLIGVASQTNMLRPAPDEL